VGFTVYAACYIEADSSRSEEVIADLRQMHGVSLLIPRAETITVDTDRLTHLEQIPKHRRIAWLYSKVSFSLNPYLAEAVFILKLANLARRLGPGVLVILSDDGGLIGDARKLSFFRIAVRCFYGMIQTPLWLVLWIARRGG